MKIKEMRKLRKADVAKFRRVNVAMNKGYLRKLVSDKGYRAYDEDEYAEYQKVRRLGRPLKEVSLRYMYEVVEVDDNDYILIERTENRIRALVAKRCYAPYTHNLVEVHAYRIPDGKFYATLTQEDINAMYDKGSDEKF